MVDFAQKNLEELKLELQKREEELQDLQEEMHFVLSKTTNHHLPGNTRKKYEEDIKELQEQIEKIKDLICRKEKAK